MIDGGSSGTVGVQARNPGIVAPGDYYSLLLLSMRAPSRGPVPSPSRSARRSSCAYRESSGGARAWAAAAQAVGDAACLPASDQQPRQHQRGAAARLRPHRSPSWPHGRRAAGGEPAQHPPGVTGVIAIPYRGGLRGRVEATATVRFASRALAGPGTGRPRAPPSGVRRCVRDPGHDRGDAALDRRRRRRASGHARRPRALRSAAV